MPDTIEIPTTNTVCNEGISTKALYKLKVSVMQEVQSRTRTGTTELQ
jgi:hypothetical protein